MDRPKWDHPAPNAGCQQGHRLIEFYSAAEAKDCPLCRALAFLDSVVVHDGSRFMTRAEARAALNL